MRENLKIILLTAVGVFAGVDSHAWDIKADFSTVNGAGSVWKVGEANAGVFVQAVNYYSDARGDFWGATVGDAVWKSNVSYFDYGIDPGGVSLDSDAVVPVARWIAPYTGKYKVDVEIGGSTAWGPGGFGNANATHSSVLLNGVNQVGSYDAVTNVYSWHISQVNVVQGQAIDAQVGLHYVGGNTNLKFSVVPVGGVGGSVSGATGQQVTCKNLTSATSVVIKLKGSTVWDCVAAGLIVNSGDVIQETVKATVN